MDEPEPQLALEQYFRASGSKPDGWDVAEQYHETKRLLPDDDVREKVAAIAAQAILRRAVQVLGASSKRAKLRYEPYLMPGRGEIALEPTLENMAGRKQAELGDIVMEQRERRRVSAVLMLDTSLSMTGRNLALAAVAAAVLAGKLEAEDYALVSFETTASLLKPINQRLPLQEMVTRLLEVPASGYTNIEDGLKVGLQQLERGRQPRKFGILISDGRYTLGGDPLTVAARFPRLYVLATEDYKMDRELCRQMAAPSGGSSYQVDSYAALPRALSKLLDAALR